MHKQALVGYKKALGTKHISTLFTVNSLRNLYYKQGRHIEAEAIYKRTLVGYKKALGIKHASTLDIVNSLKILYLL